MPVSDNDATIRDRAYALWEAAGRPSGFEHQHWAEARRQIEAETAVSPLPVGIAEVAAEPEPPTPDIVNEFVLLRRALYSPEPFSFELFGSECPVPDRTAVIRQAA